MKQVLHKPETSGRLMKWALELSEFDIRYKPKRAIKGQVLSDFVMEFTPTELAEDTRATPDLPIWKLFVDGATNAQGSGARLILTSPEGIDFESALRFGFQASNKEAEYEAVIAGLNLTHSMEVDQLEVCSDSQLVVKQIEDTYEAKCEKNDPIPKKGKGITEEVRASSGKTHTQSRELSCRCPSKTGDSLLRRSQQTDACRAPCRALYRSI